MLFHYSGFGVSDNNAGLIKALLQMQLNASVIPAFVTHLEVTDNGNGTYNFVFTLSNHIPVVDITKVKQALYNVFNSGYTITGQTVSEDNNVSNSNSGSYVVLRGDTLSKIGAKFGVRWQDIANLNNIHSPYIINVGQTLRLPTGANTTNTTPVITGANTTPSGNIDTKVTNTPKPKEQSWSDYLQETFGVAPIVLGVAGFAILLVVLSPKRK